MLEQLASALDGLAATEPESLTDAELHDAVVAIERESARLAAQRARLLVVWDARRVWASDGSKAASARLARDCGLSPRAAKAEVRRACRLRHMPATMAALADGEISADHVDELAPFTRPPFSELFARDETLLVEQAKTLPFRQFHRAVAYWRMRADAEVADDRAERQRQGRFLDITRTFADTVDVRGLLDPLEGTIVLNELQRLEQELFEQDWKAAKAEHGDDTGIEHLGRTAKQRRADALVEMARRSAAMPPGYHPARPLFTVVVGYETFAGPVCELFDGTPVTPRQAAHWLTDADIERIVFDGPSRVIDIGERRRFFTGAVRRAVEVRDRCCTFPGCDEPVHRCDVDHVVEYSKGGPTTQDNGRLYCRYHNQQRNRRPDLEPQPDSTPTGPDPPDP